MPKRKAATSQSVAQNRRWEMTEAPSVPLLLLPGTLCDARAFGSVAHVAGAVPVDLTGHSAVDAAVDAILAAAPDRFVPVGFSLGGIVTLALARRAPDRIAAMALVATNCREVPAENHGVRRAAVTGRDPAALVGDDLWPLYVHPDRAGDAGLRDLVIAMARDCPAGTAERQTELALSRSDSRAWLGELDCPALVLAGADDAVTPLAVQRELADGLPRARMVVLEQAGHFVLLERPDACQAVFSQWLQSLTFEPRQPEHLADAAAYTRQHLPEAP